MSEPHDRSAPALVGDLLSQTTELFRKELQLFRAEIGEKSTHVFTAIGLIAAAAVIALTALNVLAAALVAAIENLGIDGGWAALIVGLAFAILAYILAQKGVNDLKAQNLTPDRTQRSLQKDAALAKEKTS
jgi:TRAP-type C4-dicarboxylate transport system permease small subunit